MIVFEILSRFTHFCCEFFVAIYTLWGTFLACTLGSGNTPALFSALTGMGTSGLVQGMGYGVWVTGYGVQGTGYRVQVWALVTVEGV